VLEPLATVSRAAWALQLLAYEGTPFHHQGRAPGIGLDCPAPMICAARHFGIVPPTWDISAYPGDPDGNLQPTLDAYLIRVARDDLQLGDVVLNAFGKRQPRHLAYIVGERWGQWEMLHADARTGGAIVERIQYGRYYRFVQGYRVPGVE
jgi:cell wall-associated NlpC family hydrolase